MDNHSAQRLRNLRYLGIATRIALGLFMLSSVATLLIGSLMALGETQLFQRAIYDWRTGETSFVSILSPTVFWVALNCAIGAIIVAIPFLWWLHRSYAWLVAEGLPGLRTTPNGAVAGFVIPFVNLALPPKIMRELYNRTRGEDEYQVDTDVNDIQVWWSCFLAGFLVLAVVAGVNIYNASGSVFITTPPGVNAMAALLGLLFLLGSALHLFLVVGQIAKVQPYSHEPEAEPA